MRSHGLGEKTVRESLLNAIQAASVAFTGEARLIDERPVAATETAFRGAGYRLTLEISPKKPLFGTLPGTRLRLQGDTKYPSAQRLSLGEQRFPPDELRQEPYWDRAQPDSVQPVLVILAEPPDIHLLTGPDDDLPNTVELIHYWIKLDERVQESSVLTDLGRGGCSPLAYVAGFELLTSRTPDLVALTDSFLSLPSRPGAATEGILNQLYLAAISLPQSEIIALARRLLTTMPAEYEPAALLGYLTWFDAHHHAWSDNPQMKAAVVAEAERATQLTFQGPDALAWQIRVQQQAAFLLSGGNETI